MNRFCSKIGSIVDFYLVDVPEKFKFSGKKSLLLLDDVFKLLIIRGTVAVFVPHFLRSGFVGDKLVVQDV